MASAVAAYRRESDIAVGNVVGSNIFNTPWILGITAGIKELPFDAISNIDIISVIAATMLILLAVVTSRAASISRLWGAIFVCVCRVSGVRGATQWRRRNALKRYNVIAVFRQGTTRRMRNRWPAVIR